MQNLLDIVNDNVKPTMMCLVETHLKGEKIEDEFPDYEIVRNDRTKAEEGEGILIAVRKEVAKNMIEIERTEEEEETLWVKVDNNQVKLRIGVIYAPQESRTNIETLRRMYNGIQAQAKIAKKQGEEIFVVGDFNAKIYEQLTKGGKLLKEMTERNELFIANQTAKGKWTRIEGGTKSIIDYVLVNEEMKSNIELEIDESKALTPYYIKEGKAKYTDHCAMIGKVNWKVTARTDQRKKKIVKVTDETKMRYRELTNTNELMNIAEETTQINDKYEEWERAVIKISKSCFTKCTVNKYTKTNHKRRKLMKKRRELIKSMKSEPNDQTKLRIELINEHIEEEIKTEIGEKNRKTADRIQQAGGVNSPDFWKVVKVNKEKTQKKTTMKDKNGVKQEDENEIKEIYRKWYEDLLTQKEASNSKEIQAETFINECFEKLEREAEKSVTSVITEEELENVIKSLKVKKAEDYYGMKNEYIKYGGDQLKKSLLTILNEVLVTRTVPKRWSKMKIKSIYKNKGDRSDMANQRGIFLTSVTSKIFEKILLIRNKEIIEQEMSPFQGGGRRGRGIQDHLFTVRAIIDESRYFGRDLYVFYGDLEKCFDKLWLKDSIIELWKSGVPADEVKMIYEMNREANIVVGTPYGMTSDINVQEVVRQGTIWGPTLCAVSTEKVNNIGTRASTRYGRSTDVESLTFVDDICGLGNNETVSTVIRNCKEMEDRRKMTFNNKKSNYQVIELGNKKYREEIDESVKNGQIKKKDKYKYLGETINNKADYHDTIAIKEQKSNVKRKVIKANAMTTGSYCNQVIDKLYKTVGRSNITFNVETWTNMKKSEIKRMEQIQKDSLLYLYEMPKTTPYKAFLSEIGLWTIENYMNYKKLLLFHNLHHSPKERIAKRILDEQIENEVEKCWYSELLDITKIYEIEIEQANELSKDQWRKYVTLAIERKSERELKEEGKKSRFVNNVKRKKYVDELNKKNVKIAMKVRLNMIEVKGNFKGSFSSEDMWCPICRECEDTTEHVFECKVSERIDKQVTKNNIYDEDSTIVKNIAEYVEKAMEMRERKI